MKMMLLGTMLVLTSCASVKTFVGGDQCIVPTDREAKITRRAWK